MISEYIKNLAKNKEIFLKIKVLPGAPRSEFKGEMADGTLKIAVAAAPEKNKANLVLIKFLAQELSLEKSAFQIISGTANRLKLVKITDNRK